MSIDKAVDIAGLLPTDFVERDELWPGAPQRMGAYVGQSGLQGFASHSEYQVPIRIAMCDSEPRLHLSVWLRDGVDVCIEGKRSRVNGRDMVTGFMPGVPLETDFHGRAHHVGLMFRPDVLETLAGEEGALFFERLRRGGPMRSRPGDARTLQVAHELDTLLLSARPHPLLCEAKCLELLGCFMLADESIQLPAHGERERLQHARELLLANIAEPPTIADLARACGLNTLKLKRGFKALFGLPVYAFYQQERMRIAHDLLSRGAMSVTEVGSHIGYNNLSHFSAAFQRSHGVLPSELRKSGFKL
ncbi:helix-turn-helix transcriptional regulator [Pseudomonas sp. LRF_L74]|uniref:helix-turn-helix transcriptional regulator n=1 Tax=Pseudomonas sp. LRF_L74 TaxID=3369422 RepID=UPI003F5E1C8B